MLGIAGMCAKGMCGGGARTGDARGMGGRQGPIWS